MLEVIRYPYDLHALKNEWNRLADLYQMPTLRYEWFSACVDAFCENGELRIVVVRSQGVIKGIAPLISIRRNGMERLELLGMSLLFETGGFVYEDEESLEELFHGILSLKKPLVLRRIRWDSAECRIIRRVCKKRALLTSRNDAASLFLPLSMSSDQLEAKMSSSSRANVRRKRARADKYGDVKFEIVCPDADDLETYLPEVFRVESSGWKRRNRTAVLSMPVLRKFFTLYSHEAARLGMLRFFFLKIGGETVAVRLAVEYAKRLWELKIGYDEKWGNCSPGILLTHETLKYACEKGLDAYEFLGIDEPWIHTWTDHEHKHEAMQMYPSTLSGILWCGIDVTRFAVARILKAKN